MTPSTPTSSTRRLISSATCWGVPATARPPRASSTAPCDSYPSSTTVSRQLVIERRGVAVGFSASLFEGAQLGWKFVHGRDDVEVVGVLGGHPERLPLAAATEHHGNVVAVAGLVDRGFGVIPLARKARALTVNHRDDDLQRLFKLRESLSERAKFETQLLVLELEPSGTDTQYRPPAADHIQRGDFVGQQGRVAVGVSGNQGRKLHTGGGRGQRTQRRVGLQHRFIRRPQRRQLIEVVHHQHGVETGGLGFLSLGLYRGKEVG
jgi:hypothetical protein